MKWHAKIILGAIAVFLGLAISSFLGLVFFVLLKPFFPECSSHQVDGQCGLPTFLRELYSLGLVVISWPITSVLIAFRGYPFLKRELKQNKGP
jgi:hypothetical protein